MYTSYVLGILIFPWRILRSASTFLQFLGGYSIFLGPFVGIFLTDYLVCRKGNVFVKDLYTPEGRYWYHHGMHWRAAVAYVAAVVPPIPGFAVTFGVDLPTDALHLYQVGWLFTCIVSSVVYWALMTFCGNGAAEERAMGYESISDEQIEPFLGLSGTTDGEVVTVKDGPDEKNVGTV